MVDTKQTSFFETAIGGFSGGYFMNKTNDCLIGSYVCGLKSELFLHTDKNQLFRDQYAVKQLHFDFESVRVCYFDIDLRMSSLSNKWEPFF